jgi:hypothetical protein
MRKASELFAELHRASSVSPELQAHLLAYLEKAAKAETARAQSMARTNRRRSLGIEMAIKEAAGALPRCRGISSVVRKRIQQMGPQRFGLADLPDARTVRNALRRHS